MYELSQALKPSKAQFCSEKCQREIPLKPVNLVDLK